MRKVVASPMRAVSMANPVIDASSFAFNTLRQSAWPEDTLRKGDIAAGGFGMKPWV
jgi:hypothetical protein